MEKAGDLSELDKMMEVLPDDHPAKIAYLKVRIIYLSPKALDELSFEDIEKMEKEAMEKTGHQVTEEELEEWLKMHKAVAEPDKKEEKQNEQECGQEAGKQ